MSGAIDVETGYAIYATNPRKKMFDLEKRWHNDILTSIYSFYGSKMNHIVSYPTTFDVYQLQ